MSRSVKGMLMLGAVAALLLTVPPVAAQPVLTQRASTPPAAVFEGIGRPATSAEIKAWDIDVRPDFKGLPKGSGTVAKGQVVWESKCASCHGVFGESNEVFTPIATGVVKDDIKTGKVSGLTKSGIQRSTMMKVATLSTLWDYINRAMPWNAPKTLTVEEVYAVTAYILNLADVVPDDFTLSDSNMRETQARLPNRNGMTQQHSMWKVSATPDVNGAACMSHCATDPKVVSFLPDYAKSAHGNLAEQMRPVGGVRGVHTAVAVAAAGASGAAGAPQPAAAPKLHSEFAGIRDAANKGTCLACHGIDRKLVGPGFNEIAAKYKNNDKAESYLAHKIRVGSQGVWGAIPMPPSAALYESEAALLARWIMKGSPE